MHGYFDRLRILKRARVYVVPIVAVTGTCAYLLWDAMHSRSVAGSEPAIPPAVVPEAEEVAATAAPAVPAVPAVRPERVLLAQSLESRRDPFQSQSMAVLALEEDIKLKSKEIEVLRLTLEERQLRQQIAGVGRDSTQVPGDAASAVAAAADPDRVELLAVIDSERRRAALLSDGARAAWVREGGAFGIWQLVEVRDNGVTLAGNGATRKLSVEP